jgi:hypothetical protein
MKLKDFSYRNSNNDSTIDDDVDVDLTDVNSPPLPVSSSSSLLSSLSSSSSSSSGS